MEESRSSKHGNCVAKTYLNMRSLHAATLKRKYAELSSNVDRLHRLVLSQLYLKQIELLVSSARCTYRTALQMPDGSTGTSLAWSSVRV
jgi:hypothetical protein